MLRKPFLYALLGLSLVLTACAGPSAGPQAQQQAPANAIEQPAGKAAPPATGGDTALSGCPARGQALRVAATQTEDYSSHPMEARFSSTHYTRLHQLPLFGVDPQETHLEPAYGAAESWELLPGARGMKIKLWKGLTFNNGDPVTAEDVKFSFELAATDYADMQLVGIVKAFGIKVNVIDDLNLQLDFKEGAVTAATELSPLVYPLYVVSRKYHGNGAMTQQAFDDFREKPLAAGPYEVASREASKYIILKAARKDPVLGCPTYDRIEVRTIVEMGTRMAQFQTGQLDIIEGHRDLMEDAKAAGARIASKPAANIIGLYLFQTYLPDNIFKDVRLRQAAAYAIDHETIAKSVWRGVGVEPWGCTWPPPTEISTAEPAYVKACGTPYPYDPAKAKQLLADAGYGPNNRPKIKLVFYNNYPEEPDLAQAMQPMLNAVGFDTQIDRIDRAESNRRRLQEQYQNSILFFGPGGRATALAGAYSVYGPDQKYGPKDDKEVVEALDRASRASTEAEYMKAMAEIGRLVHDKAYGPGFFAAGSIWFINQKIPDWGLEKDKGRGPLNLAALVTRRQ